MASSRLPRHTQSDYSYINRQLHYLSDEAYAYEQFDADGQIGHARAFCTDLSAAITRIPNWQSIRSLEIYADTLTTQTPIDLSTIVDELIIFARHVIVDSKIAVKVSRDTLIRFYCSASSCPFDVAVTTPKGQRTVTINLPVRCQAVDINIDGSTWDVSTSPLPDPPLDRFNTPSLADRILDKTLQKPQFNDNMNEYAYPPIRGTLLITAQPPCRALALPISRCS